jgi:hypothetical protein
MQYPIEVNNLDYPPGTYPLVARAYYDSIAILALSLRDNLERPADGGGTAVDAGTGSGNGVYAHADSGNGVTAQSRSGRGIWAVSQSGPGIDAQSDTHYAGRFFGKVYVSDVLEKSGSTFKIDHPLDPANKYLSHSVVESPDMKNIYDGIAALNATGDAVVELPEWFGELNNQFRYQLTCVGAYAPVYVAEEIRQNRFKIAGGKPGMKVSWQVTGIRQDKWAKAHRIRVEERKPNAERGYYLHPKLYGRPETKAIHRLPPQPIIRPVVRQPAPQVLADVPPGRKTPGATIVARVRSKSRRKR